jgi:hypothetical protein
MPSVQRASYRRELGLDLCSGRCQRTDNDNSDQSGNQPVLDGRRAGLTLNKALKKEFHDRHPRDWSINVAETREATCSLQQQHSRNLVN